MSTLQIPTLDMIKTSFPAQYAASASMLWIPSATPGKSAKLLHVLPHARGFVELLRMQPGVSMPLHRHSGEIHAWNIEGSRRLCTGEVIGPGDYVYEPPGNVDWWTIVGETPMTAFVVVMGEVEFLDANGTVRARASARTQLQEYRNYCAAHGLPLRAEFGE